MAVILVPMPIASQMNHWTSSVFSICLQSLLAALPSIPDYYPRHQHHSPASNPSRPPFVFQTTYECLSLTCTKSLPFLPSTHSTPHATPHLPFQEEEIRHCPPNVLAKFLLLSLCLHWLLYLEYPLLSSLRADTSSVLPVPGQMPPCPSVICNSSCSSCDQSQMLMHFLLHRLPPSTTAGLWQEDSTTEGKGGRGRGGEQASLSAIIWPFLSLHC